MNVLMAGKIRPWWNLDSSRVSQSWRSKNNLINLKYVSGYITVGKRIFLDDLFGVGCK